MYENEFKGQVHQTAWTAHRYNEELSTHGMLVMVGDSRDVTHFLFESVLPTTAKWSAII